MSVAVMQTLKKHIRHLCIFDLNGAEELVDT